MTASSWIYLLYAAHENLQKREWRNWNVIAQCDYLQVALAEKLCTYPQCQGTRIAGQPIQPELVISYTQSHLEFGSLSNLEILVSSYSKQTGSSLPNLTRWYGVPCAIGIVRILDLLKRSGKKEIPFGAVKFQTQQFLQYYSKVPPAVVEMVIQ